MALDHHLPSDYRRLSFTSHGDAVAPFSLPHLPRTEGLHAPLVGLIVTNKRSVVSDVPCTQQTMQLLINNIDQYSDTSLKHHKKKHFCCFLCAMI